MELLALGRGYNQQAYNEPVKMWVQIALLIETKAQIRPYNMSPQSAIWATGPQSAALVGLFLTWHGFTLPIAGFAFGSGAPLESVIMWLLCCLCVFLLCFFMQVGGCPDLFLLWLPGKRRRRWLMEFEA